MSRWLPFPYWSAFLLLVWLLLNETLSVGQLILGTVLALAAPMLIVPLDLPKLAFRRPLTILRLLGLVLVDIAQSNIAVTKIILNPAGRKGTSGFISIPLQLTNPYGLAVLAAIITATPGTCWVDHDPTTGVLVIHVLDLRADEDLAAIIKNNYERLLLEIFE